MAPAEYFWSMFSVINTLLLLVTGQHAFHVGHTTPYMKITVYNKTLEREEKKKYDHEKTPAGAETLTPWQK